MSLRHATLIYVFFVAAPATAQPYDYILKGGHVMRHAG